MNLQNGFSVITQNSDYDVCHKMKSVTHCLFLDEIPCFALGALTGRDIFYTVCDWTGNLDTLPVDGQIIPGVADLAFAESLIQLAVGDVWVLETLSL